LNSLVKFNLPTQKWSYLNWHFWSKIWSQTCNDKVWNSIRLLLSKIFHIGTNLFCNKTFWHCHAILLLEAKKETPFYTAHTHTNTQLRPCITTSFFGNCLSSWLRKLLKLTSRLISLKIISFKINETNKSNKF